MRRNQADNPLQKGAMSTQLRCMKCWYRWLTLRVQIWVLVDYSKTPHMARTGSKLGRSQCRNRVKGLFSGCLIQLLQSSYCFR
ncbi:hypothetical protein Hanom_Chr09g00799231 [Helianthus anomalus]